MRFWPADMAFSVCQEGSNLGKNHAPTLKSQLGPQLSESQLRDHSGITAKFARRGKLRWNKLNRQGVKIVEVGAFAGRVA